ncbi:NAD(P)/FAD-dependent oxidoreductase [Pseudoramibacter faecis]|uniref:NAD(P)/FAD-dependent oxidoreductase n=1 Tax=Pseudoramibacter faecis TaxID=3108534 RepID=UPI002E7AA4DC|nr:NAD(P)/FAD-dependent oxidoreductase [Pseudoramibacter sp. HA2172]
MKKTIVIGGGPAGMTAALAAAKSGDSVTLLEKNEKLGKKLYITGKGRCNLTNDCDEHTFLDNVVHNARFMYSAIAGFSHWDLMALIESQGCPLKVERGNRVFPVSDKSSDIIRAFGKALGAAQVDVRLHAEVTAILVAADRAVGVALVGGETLAADKVVMATGGLSYRSTGSDGWGLREAERLGHTLAPCRPSLVGIEIKETWLKVLQGLTLKNIEAALYCGERLQTKLRGEVLMTHFGLSGPLILTFSALMDEAPERYRVVLDLKPALTEAQLDARLLRDFDQFKNRQIDHTLKALLPKRMIPVILAAAGVVGDKKINQISRVERKSLTAVLKHLPLTIRGFYDPNTAIVTAGGVSTAEINPKTMASKRIAGLYFAGEMIDVDGFTGGFNIQIAASTGFAAGTRRE